MAKKKEKSTVEKRARQARKNTSINKKVMKNIKGLIKKVVQSNILEDLRVAISKIDKAAKKGILHKNTAARKKSRLMKKFNKATKK